MNNYILSSQYGSKEKKLSSYLSKMRKKHIIECFERCLFFLGKNPISLVYSFGLRVTKSKIINPSGDLSLMQERLITNLFRSFYFLLLHTSFCFSVSFEINLPSEKTRR